MRKTHPDFKGNAARHRSLSKWEGKPLNSSCANAEKKPGWNVSANHFNPNSPKDVSTKASLTEDATAEDIVFGNLDDLVPMF
jgi:hypothetical protein